MDPLICLPQFQLLVCKECKHACLSQQVPTHLRTIHPLLTLRQRHKITAIVQQTPDILNTAADLHQLYHPIEPIPAIPSLGDPCLTGLACQEDGCALICTHRTTILKHYRTKHSWKNPWVKGGDVRHQAQSHSQPWRTNVRCQRLFKGGSGSFWFEVLASPASASSSSSSYKNNDDDKLAPDTFTSAEDLLFLRRFHSQASEFEARTARVIAEGLDCEPNPWLERTGWVGHLRGLDYEKLRSAISLEPAEGWEGPDSHTMLREVWGSLDRLIQAAQRTATLKVAGVATLYELHRRDHVRKARVPFTGRMQPQTRAKYANVWKRIIGYLFRTQTWYEEDCPAYCLTPKQEKAYSDLEGYLAKALEAYDLPLAEATLKVIDQKSLQLFISLLDHELPNSPYESIILSALSVMGLRPSAEAVSWLRPHEYTSILSAVIKISRLLVLQKSYEECRQMKKTADTAGMSGISGTLDNDEEEVAPGLFDSVRLKVLRYLTIVSSRTKPSPIDWIFEIRAYGFAISSTTSLVADVQWTGERVTFGKTSFTMSQLIGLVRSLSLELHRTMRQLLLIKGEGEGKGEGEAGAVRVPIPTPDLSTLEDDAGNASIGYTFLTDVRNKGMLSSQSGWVLDRILGDPALRTEWLNGSDLRPRAVARYGELVEQFRTKLLLLMHLTGGQPGRTTEILSLRHCNTSYGGPRNIFLWKGLVCFATSYHKGYQSQQRLKVIHRYLPNEVGVELVRYLWLVLPFWQNVLGLLDKDDDDNDNDDDNNDNDNNNDNVDDKGGSSLERSAYLFSHKIVRRRSAEKQKQQQARPEELWQGDKMRRLLEDATVRLMETKVNIHNYRHIVIAIGRKYLQGIFKDSSEASNNRTGYSGSNDNDNSDEDGFAAVLAHQAAHTVQTNGITYGLTKQQFGLGTALDQEQFWQASVLWHQFLTFKSSQPNGGMPKKLGRRVLLYETDRRHHHQQQESSLMTAGPLRVRKRDCRSYAPYKIIS